MLYGYLNDCLTLVCQVRRCALHVPALSQLIPSPRHPSISSPAATCSAAPACNGNHKRRTLSLCPHPITSPVLPARAAPHAVTSHVCISDWSLERLNYASRTCEKNQDVSKNGIKAKMWRYGAMSVVNSKWKVKGCRRIPKEVILVYVWHNVHPPVCILWHFSQIFAVCPVDIWFTYL